MKRKAPIILAILVLITSTSNKVSGQSTDTVRYWATSGVFSLNLAQSSFTHWAAGGQTSVAINGLVSLTANYKKDKAAWDNSLTLGYGKMQQKNSVFGWVKTDDRIDLQSKFGLQASKAWYYSALLSFKSQMAPGYTYSETDKTLISNRFSPAYVLIALGMDYKPKPVFSAFISPLTSKMTIVTDEELSAAGAFGVDAGKKFRGEFGAYANLLFKKDEIIKNVNFMSKLDLFTNYIHNPQNIDVNWENMLVLKVNKFISATISTNLLYDDDIRVSLNDIGTITGKRAQFKEVIGVGFTYKFEKK